MLPTKMNINKNLLSVKGHFFLFNAGTAPLVPYLSTYAKQLGFSSSTVGLIYTVLPIFGLVAKPTFGVIADNNCLLILKNIPVSDFKIQKSLFIAFQLVTLISFGAIYFIPGSGSIEVELDCNDGVSMLRSCYPSHEAVDKCKVTMIGSQMDAALCDMKCDMTSPKMWQTVCEHWQLPQYCYSNTGNIKYSTNLTKITMNNECAYMSTGNVTLDGYSFAPHCRVGAGYVDINQPCTLTCTDRDYSAAIGAQKPNMTCVNETLNYRLCANDSSKLTELEKAQPTTECSATCDLDKTTPWRIMEICDGWQADVTNSCKPKTKAGEHFPGTLSFVGTVLPSSLIMDGRCVNIQLKHIELPDGTTHYPNCVSKAQYQMEAELFRAACAISCNNSLMNEMFQSNFESENRDIYNYTSQYWMFFAAMVISWIGQAVVVTFADAITFNILGERITQYGKQRLWGSVGWGLFSLMTGALIDVFSDGAFKNYTIAFVLMAVFLFSDAVVSCFIDNKCTRMSLNILADVGTLLSSLPTFLFMLWTVAVGFCTGLLWNFLFWHLEDIAHLNCDGLEYTKTLQGLVSAIQAFGGEIPFMFVSGHILKKVGHTNMMSIVLFAFGARFMLYSFLSDPWWVLPIEMLQGITFGMFYPTMTSYANVVSPPGTETTVQGLVGAVFEGVGVSLGSLVGGQLYDVYGGGVTFRCFGVGSLICGAIHALLQYLLKDRTANGGVQGYSSVIRYEQPNDMVYILEDMCHDTREDS